MLKKERKRLVRSLTEVKIKKQPNLSFHSKVQGRILKKKKKRLVRNLTEKKADQEYK